MGGAAPFQVRVVCVYSACPLCPCQGGVMWGHPGRLGPVPGARGVRLQCLSPVPMPGRRHVGSLWAPRPRPRCAWCVSTVPVPCAHAREASCGVILGASALFRVGGTGVCHTGCPVPHPREASFGLCALRRIASTCLTCCELATVVLGVGRGFSGGLQAGPASMQGAALADAAAGSDGVRAFDR